MVLRERIQFGKAEKRARDVTGEKSRNEQGLYLEAQLNRKETRLTKY